MIHLRIVVPAERTPEVRQLLGDVETVTNVIFLPGAAQKPAGDVFLCDVARADASVLISDLRELGIGSVGSIAVERVDAEVSDLADAAERASDPGIPDDPVLWEEVEARTSENAVLTIGYLIFLTAAALIAAVGIMFDELILIVGAMVVGPEFGPVAGFCVAFVNRRRQLALRSFYALAIGFPVAIAVTYLATLALKGVGQAPAQLGSHPVTEFIAEPGFFSFYVAVLAGVAGLLSLTTAKSGALIGVLISVTTVPAAANVAVAAAYRDWGEVSGAAGQLGVNLAGILIAGVATLYVQRLIYIRRKRQHLAAIGRPPHRRR